MGLILYEDRDGIVEHGDLSATFQDGFLQGLEIDLPNISHDGPDKNLPLTEVREGYYSGYLAESNVVVIIRLPPLADN